MAVLLVNVVEYATSAGIGAAVGVLAIGIPGAMNGIGKVAGGPVVDRVGSTRTIAASGVFEAIGLTVLPTVPTPTGVIIGSIIFGFGWGKGKGTVDKIPPELFPRSKEIIEGVEGETKHVYFGSIGKYDGVAILEVPDGIAVEEFRPAFEQEGTHHFQTYEVFEAEEYFDMIPEATS